MIDGARVFISHITEEAPIAEALKSYLKRCFGPELRVFVSSDYDSIGTGEEWYRAIVSGITQAQVVIVLLSPYSVDRRWINFESGLALGSNVRILPLATRQPNPSDVGLPLSKLHVRRWPTPLHSKVSATASPTLSERLQEQMATRQSFLQAFDELRLIYR